MSGALDLGTLFGTIELEDNYSPALNSVNAKTVSALASIGQLDTALKTTGASSLQSAANLKTFVSATSQLSVAQESVSRLSKEVRKLADEVLSAGVAVSGKLKASLNEATQKLLEAEANSKRLSNALKDVEKTAANSSKELSKLVIGMTAAGNASTVASAKLTAGMSNSGKEAEAAAAKSAAGVKKALEEANQQVNKIGFSLTEASRAAQTFGVIFTAAFTVPIVGAAVAAYSFASDFERDMTRVITLSGIAKEELQGLTKQVLELAPALGATPDQAAKALLAVTSTGIKGKEAIDLLKISLQNTAIGMGDATVNARLLTSIVKAYGEENMTAGHAAEIMFRIVRDGNADASELAGSLGRVVGIAATLGISLEDIGTFVATYTRIGVSTAEAVTAARGLIQNLELKKMTQPAKDALASVGLTVASLRQEIKELGLTAGMQDLFARFRGREADLQPIIANIRAMAGAMGTYGAQTKDVIEIQASMMKSGDTERMAAFATVSETAAFKMDKLKSEIEALAISFGTALLPIAEKLVKLFEDFVLPVLQHTVNAFVALPTPIQEGIVAIGALVAALGPLLLIVGQLGLGVSYLARTFETFTGMSALPAIQGLLATVGIGGGAVDVVAAGMSGAGATAAGMSGAGATAAATTAVTGGAAASGMSAAALTGYGLILIGIGATIYEIYENWDLVTDAVKEAYTWLKDKIVEAFTAVGEAYKNSQLPELVTTLADLGEEILTLIGRIAGWAIIGLGKAAFEGLKTVIDGLLYSINGLWEIISKPFGIPVWDTIKEIVTIGAKLELSGMVEYFHRVRGEIEWILDHIPFLPSRLPKVQGPAPPNILDVPFSSLRPGNTGAGSSTTRNTSGIATGELPEGPNPLELAQLMGASQGNTVDPKLVANLEKTAEVSKKAKKAVEDYNKVWENLNSTAGSYMDTVAALTPYQVGIIDGYLQEGHSVAELAKGFTNLTTAQIDAVKATQRYRGALGELTEQQKALVKAGFDQPNRLKPSDISGANNLNPTLVEDYFKQLEIGEKTTEKMTAAWTNMNSIGETVQDTIAGINPEIKDLAEHYAAIGANASDMVTGFKAITQGVNDLTKEQAEALIRGVTLTKNYTAALRRSSDDIRAINDQIAATQAEDALKGEALQDAQINRQTLREKDAAIKRMHDSRDANNFSDKEKLTLATQLSDELAAIENLGQSKIHKIHIDWETKTAEEVAALRLRDQELLLGLLGTQQQQSLAKNAIGLNAELKKLRDQGLDSNKELVDATIKLYEHQSLAIIASFDPVFDAWQSLNQDMRKTNASTWAAFLDDTKSFGDAFETTLIQSMWAPFRNILAGMMSDFENLFIAPIMNYFRNVLQQALINWVGSYSGISNAITNGGGGGGGGGLTSNLGGGLLNTAQGAGTKWAFNQILTHYAGSAAGFSGPLAATAGPGAASTWEVPSSLAANPSHAGIGLGGAASIAGSGIAGWQLGQWLGSKTESKPLGAVYGGLAGAGAGAALGAPYAGATWGLSIAVGAIAGAIAGWRAAGKLWDEVKDKQAALVKMFGSTEEEIKQVGLAYALTGHKGTEAEAALHKLWDAKTPQEFDAAMAPIAETLQVLKQNTEDLASASVDSAGRITEAWTRVLEVNKKYGTNLKEVQDFIKQQTSAIMSGFNDVMAAQKDAVAGYDDLKKAVDDATEAQKKLLESGTATADQLKKAAEGVKGAVENQRIAGAKASPELEDLGKQAVGTYVTRVASGVNPLDALKEESDALAVLQKEYEDLGLEVTDVGLRQLFTQNTMLRNSGTLFSGISGLTKMMTGLDSIGQETTEMFSTQQRTALQMYTRLQDAAQKAGGTTKDALLPMQDYLHQAETEAKKLGVPLDHITQQMIDQSRDLGIWHDSVTPPPTVQDAIQTLADTIDDLARALRGLPPITHIHIDTTHTSDLPGDNPPPSGGSDNGDGSSGYATGGIVRARHLATGGSIGGQNTTDTVPAWLTPGERVLTVAQNRVFESFLAGDSVTGPLFPNIVDLTSSPNDNGAISNYPWSPPPYVTETSDSGIPHERPGGMIHSTGEIGSAGADNKTAEGSTPIIVHVDARGAWFDDRGVDELASRIQQSFWTQVHRNTGFAGTMAKSALNIEPT